MVLQPEGRQQPTRSFLMVITEVVWKTWVSVFINICVCSVNVIPIHEGDYDGVKEGKYNDGIRNHEEVGYYHKLYSCAYRWPCDELNRKESHLTWVLWENRKKQKLGKRQNSGTPETWKHLSMMDPSWKRSENSRWRFLFSRLTVSAWSRTSS